MEHVYRRRLPPLPRGVLREDEACAVAWQTTEKPGVVFLRVARLPKPRNDRFLASVVFAIWFFCFFILGRNRVESTDFHIFLPPHRACKHKCLQGAVSCKCKCLQGRFRASASACTHDFVQAQVLAGAVSCKRKCLQGRFRASASACTKSPPQAHMLAQGPPSSRFIKRGDLAPKPL